MQTKVQAYVQLTDETSLKITGNYLDWLSFLTTASRLYKYPYHDQLMIYAQRPDASACAAYELWNGTMHRYIRRGAKGIALLNPTANGMRIRYVFDVSDTGTRADSRNVDVWQLTEAAEPAVRKMLAEEFSADASMRLAAQIDQLAERQALAYWNEHRRDILDSVDDSALSEYDDFAAGASFRKAAAASISAVIQTRCGLEPELLREDFQEVMDWNTPAAAAELGKAVSTIAEQVLRQIERTVRNAERSMEHERTEVHTARGLPAAGNETDRRGTAAAGQVRDDAPAVSGERASGAVYAAAPERAVDDAPARNRAERAESAEPPDADPAEAKRRDRGHEGGESDALGSADEQPETSGGGNDSFGADLQLSGYTPQLEQMSFFLPTENEQIQLVDNFEAESAQAPFAFSVPQEVVDEFLRSGSNMSGGKRRIYQYFTETPARSMTEKANFLKDEYGIGGRSPAVSGADGSNEAHDSKGIVLQKNGCAPVKMQWTKAAARIDTLIRQGQYLTQDAAADRGRQEADEDALPKETAPDANDENRAEQGEEADEPVSAEESAASADAAENPASSETAAYAVGDTVYLDGTPFVIEAKSAFGVQLRDPSQRYPIFRAESLPRFERLLAADERNAHFLPAAETALRNIVLDLSASASEQREPAPEPPAAENFRITDEHLGEGSAKAKFSANIEAISVLKMVESEHRSALPQEQEVLSRYVGWGGLPQAFDERSEAWHSEYSALKSLLTQEEYEAARASTLNAHYTSPTVIRAIYAAVEQLGFRSGNVLEPSCGVGNFFGMLPDSMKESRLYGVELDSITGRIAQQLYPKAHITIAGFETTDRRDFFDLAIGNVPFGAYQVQDKAFARHNFLIHDYFFAKTLEQVRPGGVIAYITSKGTMDKQNPAVRRYIAERAELLGAIRLPNTAFKANAGTEVTSDILFLQKRERPLAVEPDWVHLGQTANGIPVNSYFAAHPEMMLGTMVREPGLYGNENETACIPLEGAVLSEQLTEAVQHIRGEYQAAELPNQLEGEAAADTIPADPNVKNYAFTMVDGEVYYRTNSVMAKQKLPLPALERIRGMVDLRQQVNDLIQAQLDNADDAALAPIQARLNQQYDAFTAKYGLINARSNANAFSSDSSYYLLCSLEVLNEQGGLARKADMFTKRTIRQQTVITHVDTAAEALAVSIAEKARVDLPYMAQLTGIEPEQLTKELNGVIFPVPNQDIYVTADEYLSGNVRQKLREAMQAAAQNPLYLPNVTALKAAQPKDLDASEIDVRLGATWLDKSVIQDFMLETFAPPMYLHRVIHVNYSEYTAEWNISGKSAVSESSVTAYVTYGTRRANAYRILEDTLNLRDVRIYDMVTDPDGKERRVLNQKETTLAQQKQQAIKAVFREWIWKDPNRRETLVAQYNELFNATRPREYDGQHITFGGMTPDIQLREHQRNAVAHILYGGNTLLAHEVGAGKTFEMVAAAMESKRLGLCQKPLFVVPNHLTEQWASEFIRLYPSASILVATKKDFERANRQKFCARIATGDYDAVIIGHSQFERIPVSQERQQRLLREQLDDITHGIEELKYQRGEQFSIKQLERTRKQLENRLSKLEAEERKDDVVTFEQLGVDRLYVDEAHSFKNLFLYTKMRNVAGLSQTESQKSSDMFLKCRYMDEITGGKGIVFATGTPVSNSMTELYTMQRYLQYGTLQQKSMSHFDAWASTFGETTTAIELAPEGYTLIGR